ncbi:cell wall protein DAN4-like [Pecten maximus]|uniref:cell wall protein DAN4-like n=1 Tax=Pecten maximus TaxID=6579 RepID=UPI001458FC23|nr:cell wall protein DAN4-like [Pecten maximus]XP_033736089.1 cell wall protein DAN4-like [Pecten maximus]
MGHQRQFFTGLLMCMLIHHITASVGQTSKGMTVRTSGTGNSSSTPKTTHVTPSSTPKTTPSSPHVTPSSTPKTTASSPHVTPSSSPKTTPSSPHVTPSSTPKTTPSSPHVTPSSSPKTTPSSPHVTPSSTPKTTPSSPHVTPSSTPKTTPSSPHVTPSSTPKTTPSSPHVTPSSTPKTTPSSPHVTPSSTPKTTPSSPHVTPSSSPKTTPSSPHVTPSSTPKTTPSSSHVTPSSTPKTTPSSSHVTPSSTPKATPSSPHVTPSSTPKTTPSSPHVTPSSTPKTTPSSPHVTPSSTPKTTPSSPHVTPSSTPKTTPSSPHVTPSSTPKTTPSSPHVTPSSTQKTTPSSPHVTPSSSPKTTPSSPHVTPSSTPKTTPSSPHVTPSSTPKTTPSSPHVTPSSTPNMTPSKPGSSTVTGTTPASSPVSGKVTITEVYYNLPQSDHPDDLPEFIEIYGDRDLSLNGYTIVLFAGEDMKAFLIISLNGYSLPRTNAAFLISTFNASFGPDLILTNKSLTGPNGDITMVTLYKNESSSFTMDSTPSRDGLVDYVVYSSGASDMPSAIRDWSSGFKAVVKDSQYPYESVSRCFSDEPDNQRAFTLSLPTPGEKNACDLRDNYPTINEVGHLGKHHTCFIEIQFASKASQALNSIFLAIYSQASTTGHSIQNVTFDLWNERINESGYYLLSGRSNGSLTLDCDKTFVDGTIVIVLYQVPTDLKHFNKEFSWKDTYQYIKDGVTFNVSAPLDKNLANIVLPKAEEEGFPWVSLQERASLFLSGQQSLSSCGRSIYNVTDPTPGGPNNCPLIPSIVPPVTMTTTHHTVKPNHVYINEVTYSAKNSEEYIEFKGDIQGDFSHYYIILFNTCTGKKIGGVPLNHTLDQKGFLQFNHTSTHTFSETLKHTGSIALGLYTNNVATINVTQGLLDAIVMKTSTNGDCPSLSFSLKYLTPNVMKPVVLSKNDLDNGMTLSRCSGNLRNSTAFMVTKFLTESTPATENICETPVPHVLPSKTKSPNAVMITIAVVASCLVVFLLIFGVLVVIMKRKRRGVLQFRLALLNENNDDDELFTNADGGQDLISFNTDEDATFDNKTY